MRRDIQQHSGQFFDEYQRYQIVADIINFYREVNPGEEFRILEIGANKSKHLKSFLSDDLILYTDIELDSEMQQDPEFLQVDGTDMPFENKSYDFVVATDVLEHIPAEKRGKLLEESIRVANYAAIITFPYHSNHVVSAEKRINAYYKALKGEDYVWLKEHRDQGLPDLQSIEQSLKNIECYHFHLLRGDISLWEKLYYSFFDALDSYVEWEFRKQIDQFYFSDLYDGDWSANCYRAIYVLTHEESGAACHYLEDLKSHTSPDKVAILEELLDAQKKIHLQQIITKAEDSSSTIKNLECTNVAMEKSWKFDVQKWADDNAKNAATISQISQERDHLKNQLSILQEQSNRVSNLLELIENRNTDLLSQLRTLEIGIETRDERNNTLSTQLMQLQEQFARAEKREAELSEQLECAKLTISKEQEKNMELTHQVAIIQEQYEAISQAFFWRITKPIRIVLDWLKKIKS